MKWLITFLFLFTLVNAEEITTGNLITNGNFETGNASGWTTNGDVQVLNDCCELNGVASNYDYGDKFIKKTRELAINKNLKLYNNSFSLSSDTLTIMFNTLNFTKNFEDDFITKKLIEGDIVRDNQYLVEFDIVKNSFAKLSILISCAILITFFLYPAILNNVVNALFIN